MASENVKRLRADLIKAAKEQEDWNNFLKSIGADRESLREEKKLNSMKINKRVVCPRCGAALRVETNRKLKREYMYYCPNCIENFYKIEVRGAL